ncbi:FAD-dependent monooxygenase [Streptomyces sp. MMBL 11-3]|uniref:FAD-dependent monooxygenase n=1 Tax=Streptomyces sp. MMBL 11-3 TaxID=3382639 RepID=UPI0039B5325B
MHPIRTQVVVVGGGPVGMLVAAELAAYGVGVVVLEREAATSQRPKATTVHARTVQTLARRGYLPAPSRGAGTVRSAFHFAGLPGLDITAPASEPPPLLKRSQADLEGLFERRARARGVRVLREYRMTEVRPRREGVAVLAHGPQGAVACEARYVVGADGARGAVREQAGIASDTHPATVSALMGLVRLKDPRALQAGWHRTARGWVVAKAGADGERHLRTLRFEPPADRGRPLELEELRAQASHIMGRDIAMDTPRWLSRFSDYARLARTYRSGRILLAGDAAHLHFPIGGQGLSTGLLDAVNLAWKLAATVRGSAGAGLLDSYGAERRPAAERVIANVRAQVALMDPQERFDPLRDLIGHLLADERGAAPLAAMISAQDTVLPARTPDPSPWEGRFLPNTALTTPSGPADVIGLLQQGRMLLLLLGDQARAQYEKAARRWAPLLRVVRAEPVAALPGALLVRPDGHVAWACDGGDLEEALARYVRAPETGPEG